MNPLVEEAAATLTGTSLEVIAPYLAHDLELADVKYPELRYSIEGIVVDRNIQCLDVYPLWKLASGDFEDDGPIPRRVNYTEVVPCLRPFSSLCTPLDDGTVPAEVLAWLAHPTSRGHWQLDKTQEVPNRAITLTHTEKDIVCHIENNWQVTLLSPDLRMAAHLSNQHKLAEYLRSKHFAVGLSERDYLPK